MTSGWQKGNVFQEIRPGAGFETGDFAKEKLGGYRRITLDSRLYYSGRKNYFACSLAVRCCWYLIHVNCVVALFPRKTPALSPYLRPCL